MASILKFTTCEKNHHPGKFKFTKSMEILSIMNLFLIRTPFVFMLIHNILFNIINKTFQTKHVVQCLIHQFFDIMRNKGELFYIKGDFVRCFVCVEKCPKIGRKLKNFLNILF